MTKETSKIHKYLYRPTACQYTSAQIKWFSAKNKVTVFTNVQNSTTGLELFL